MKSILKAKVTASIRMDDWHHQVILDKDPADDLIGIGLRVAGKQEFQSEKTLKEHDISFEEGNSTGRDRSVLEVITLEDPAGNPLEIFHGQIDITYRLPHVRPVPDG